MDWYYYIAIAIIVSQILFLIQIYNNYRYALAKYKRHRPGYLFKTALVVPCKGLDSAFDKNIASFYRLDYEDYLLLFVVADKSDPAYRQLCKLKDRLAGDSKASDVRILTAGAAESCGQKVHNLLHCCRGLPEDIEAIAFADSDICVRTDWLRHLIYPLRQPKNGASGGYRWYIPQKNNLATLALSALNAKVAQLLGNTIFNHLWGGSMAIRVDTFRKLQIEKIWQNALSDDFSLSYAVKKAGLKVTFVPGCLVASYESTTWPKLFEFAHRQFLITRVSAPATWLFGLFSSLYSTLGFWVTFALAVYAEKINDKNFPLFAAVPVIVFSAQMFRAILRQTMSARLLEKDLPRMKFAIAADVLLFWLWSILMLTLVLSSAFGRTIRWRGIRYKLLGPTETAIIKKTGNGNAKMNS